LKFSFFHLMPFTGVADVSAAWPTPNRLFDPARAHELYRSYVDTMVYAEACGFDWVGCNEHHFSPYGLMANCNLIGGALVYRTERIRIAMMGNLVPLNNPIRVAEEYAMLDCMSGGRLVAGLMRGIPHEYIAYNVPPDASWSRQREAIALILKAWTEPEPFGWEGEHFQFRQVSIWPRPLQQPHPPTYALGTSRESCEFAARHRLGCGVSYGPFEVMARATRYYREQCARHGWEPSPEQIVYRANMLVAATDEEAHAQLRQQPDQAPFSMRAGVREAVAAVDARNIAGEARAPMGTGALPTTFIGSPDTVIEQVRRCREVVGAGVLDLSLHPPGSTEMEPLMRALELFGAKVLPRIRDI
jgi:alkanesulfonate monooxygenase SsuD/methylene tetrahydromethanopterin reductase-like flavin-dependent oxidoreductase (luciferase family)